jgi:hypothetical protein
VKEWRKSKKFPPNPGRLLRSVIGTRFSVSVNISLAMIFHCSELTTLLLDARYLGKVVFLCSLEGKVDGFFLPLVAFNIINSNNSLNSEKPSIFEVEQTLLWL